MYKTTHCLFEQHAAATPDSPAIVSSEGTITYFNLNLRANGIARHLRKRGVTTETLVGIYMGNSPSMVAALLGIVKSGAAFVPLDPSFPRERLEFMAADAHLSFILTAEGFQWPGSGEILPIDAITNQGSGDDPGRVGHRGALDDAACVIYTSGSSGHPKGVVRTHRGIVARLEWASFRSDDVLCHNMSLCYGFSQERLFIPLMVGLPLAVVSEETGKSPGLLADAIAEFRITQITIVPAFLEQMISLASGALSRLRSLREIAVGGAQLSRKLISEFERALPGVRLVNAYGAVETGSAIRGTAIPLQDGEPVSIGRPVSGSDVYVVDESFELVPPGETGELCVAGLSIARGYLNRPDLTAERFIANPYGRGKLYRTGDLARFLPDGRIELRSRADRQVKIRGFRVELGEIEAALACHPDIQEAVASSAGDRLIAYAVKKQNANVQLTELRRFLGERLPNHMVPSVFVFLDQIPHTLNGKVSYGALPPPPQTRPAIETPYIEPRDKTEAAIAGIWARILNVDRVGINDHFIDLGGDSLLAISVAAEIESHFGLQLTAVSIFEHPTVAELASRSETRASGSVATRTAAGGSKRPLNEVPTGADF